MANERLRDAMLAAGVTMDEVATEVGVDPKTVERWTFQSDRLPYLRHRRAIANLLQEDELYLWPAAAPPERRAAIAASEVVGVYAHRHAIPTDLRNRLLRQAADRIDILVHAGLFLVERPDFIRCLAEKAGAGVTIRIAFGDPASEAVALRSAEERLGEGVLAARIEYGLVPYTPLVRTPGIEFRYHATTLYNSLFRFDDEMIVNAKSFTDVWARSHHAAW